MSDAKARPAMTIEGGPEYFDNPHALVRPPRPEWIADAREGWRAEGLALEIDGEPIDGRRVAWIKLHGDEPVSVGLYQVNAAGVVQLGPGRSAPIVEEHFGAITFSRLHRLALERAHDSPIEGKP
jgi:hypothetical protein